MTLRQTRTDFYDALIAACRKYGFEPTIRTDVIQVPFIMNIVSATQSLSFIPEFFERIKPDGVIFRPCDFIPHAKLIRPLSLAYRRNDTSPLMHNFIAIAKETAT
jgi:DNA-binding transcriptional LysR family regulator